MYFLWLSADSYINDKKINLIFQWFAYLDYEIPCKICFSDILYQ